MRTSGAPSLASRYAWFTIGVVITAFGIAFVTKAALGTTPITSLPYVFSFQFSPSVGTLTFSLNLLFIVGQAVLLRRNFLPYQWLQVLVNVVFSAFIDISLWILSWLEPNTAWLQLAIVGIGCGIVALGISIQVAPGVLTTPGEGIVKAIAIASKVRFGTVKVAFDWALIGLAAISSFVFFGQLRGIGLGTIISALLIGTIVNFFFSRMLWLSRLNPPIIPKDDLES